MPYNIINKSKGEDMGDKDKNKTNQGEGRNALLLVTVSLILASILASMLDYY